MDFNKQNFILTTSALTLSTNSLLAENLINPNKDYQYFSNGDDSDLTTTTITLTFDNTTTISRIALLNHNFQDFTMFYNGATANTFTLTSGATSTSDWSSNSETSQYLQFATLAVSSVTIEATETITANAEKHMSFLYVSDNYFTFDRIPASNSYKPAINPKQVVHQMGDGGTKIHNVDFKRSADIKYKYLTDAQREQLKSIWDLDDPFYFALFPTTTSWDGVFFEANWIGPFDFEKYSLDAEVSGFSGSMKLRET